MVEYKSFLFGDFFQLPPISKNSSKIYAFQGSVWQRLKPVVCYLTEIHRQKDESFSNLLQAIRDNVFDQKHKDILNKRIIKNIDTSHQDTTKLFTHNINVDDLNNLELSENPLLKFSK